MQYDYFTNFLGIQGFEVKSIEEEKRKGRKAVILKIERTENNYRCGSCGKKVQAGYDSKEEEIQHLPLWEYLTYVKFRRYRVNCPDCGIRTEALGFVGIRGPRVTKKLATVVKELCKVTTVKAVGIFQELNRDTVKNIDKEALEIEQSTRDLSGITVLGIDEISIGKGQSYLHMISAIEGPRGPELLFVGKGRKERSLNKFWKWFGKERTSKITHAVMDMWKPFKNSFKKHCPDVKIIYDKFHVISHLLKALNEVRKQELKKAATRFKGMLAGKKFILLSRQAHVRGKARTALNNLLTANHRLLKAHLLKESFNHLWSYKSKTWAMKFFKGWITQLKWSRLAPYRKFARLVEQHLDGILSYCDKKVSLGYIESANLKARNVIRRAYGYRDKDYMNLKIIQACTPWMNKFHPWEFTHSFSP